MPTLKIKKKIGVKDVHTVVPFADLSSSYSNFEWAENILAENTTGLN